MSELEGKLNMFRTIQREIGKVQNSISSAGTQILENEMVLKELDILEEDAQVFKLIGPVLVKQDLVEARTNVGKRIEYIKNDISRLEGNLKKFEKQQGAVREEIAELQKKAAAGNR
ncbi:hypothetical protein AB1Y20_008049 [Prymnesium parvum]|uniref:Prefoldin subunit 6 n=1 Tax=Prymnesium parvum TaxID=97485 RepID=A0AB34IVR8_PRYPA|mmetsp:Transcript_54875/g.96841  ORF Transcript_54875/g.96841 Transcript_54875/m.96841 type:complete len:116 (-) Transcript_54875:200-547(-)